LASVVVSFRCCSVTPKEECGGWSQRTWMSVMEISRFSSMRWIRRVAYEDEEEEEEEEEEAKSSLADSPCVCSRDAFADETSFEREEEDGEDAGGGAEGGGPEAHRM
jgi:hypothetical protein